MRHVLSDVDPNLTLLSIQSLQEQVDSNFDQQRAVARMTGLFGILALHSGRGRALRRDGLHGGAAHERDWRAHGAGRKSHATWSGWCCAERFCRFSIGLLIGIPISIGCSRLISAQLYQVKGWDPLVLGGSILALSICAFFASIIPAQRAASINPVKALRTEYAASGKPTREA